MIDITKCKNEACDKKAKCYRYTATPDDNWQLFATFDPKQSDCFLERIVK